MSFTIPNVMDLYHSLLSSIPDNVGYPYNIMETVEITGKEIEMIYEKKRWVTVGGSNNSNNSNNNGSSDVDDNGENDNDDVGGIKKFIDEKIGNRIRNNKKMIENKGLDCVDSGGPVICLAQWLSD